MFYLLSKSTVLLCKLCYLTQTENCKTKNFLALAFLGEELCLLEVILYFVLYSTYNLTKFSAGGMNMLFEAFKSY